MAQHEQDESEIRELLLHQLDIIEDGLVLVNDEFHIPEGLGCTKSFIDILARDSGGMYVAIELKRADASARQTLHELAKYSFALQMHFGIDSSKIRLVVLSTEWRELARPFSEFLRDTSIDTRGYRLSIDAEGVASAEIFSPLPAIGGFVTSPTGLVFLAESESKRDQLASKINAGLEPQYEHFLLFDLEYLAGAGPVQNPFGIAVVVPTIPTDDRRAYLVEVGECDDEDSARHVLEDNPWYPDEIRLSIATDGIEMAAGVTELLSPEKFGSMLDTWNPSVRRCQGKYEQLYENFGDRECLNDFIHESDRPHDSVFHGLVKASHKTRVDFVRRRIEYCLLGNSPWQKALDRFLQSADTDHRDLIIDVYCPMDTLGLLLGFQASGELISPHMVLAKRGGSDDSIGVGYVRRVRSPLTSLEGALTQVFGSVDDALLTRHFHDAWQHDEKLMDVLGLEYAVATYRPGDNFDFTDGLREQMQMSELVQQASELASDKIRLF